VIILAIESSTPSCSVALWVNSRVVAAREMLASGVVARKNSVLHSQPLPYILGVEAKNSDVLLGEIRLLLTQAGVSLSQLDAIAFGAGPGAFTGVRVACGVAQGIAMGCDIPVLLVNNLLCLAAQFEPAALNMPQSINVLSVLDARMGEAYLAGYCIALADGQSHHNFVEIIAPQLLTQLANNPNAWPAAMFERSWHVVGSGAGLLPAQFAPYCGTKSPHLIAHAIEIAALGAAAFKRGEAIDCAYAVPFYLRNNIAQTIEERRKSANSKGVGVTV
jgi:tRNA threonylcarbamoyladenosine biosynthesis protein TsaB